MKSYSILKDSLIESWIVWETHKNYRVDVHHAKTKRECKEWLDRKKKVKNEKCNA